MIYSVYALDGTLVHRDRVKGGVSTTTDLIRAGGELVARAKDRPDGSVFLRYYHTDHLGSPVAQTKPDGKVTWREAYTPYGEEWSRSGMWDDRPGFTGHVHDTDTGLTYMQARYYDPAVPRFLSPDPITFGPGPGGVGGSMDPAMFGRYGYAYNDPINVTDPDGEFGIFGAVIGGAIGGGIEAAKQIRQHGRITDGGAIGKEAAVGAVLGAVGGVGGSLVKGGVTGTLKLGVPGAEAVAKGAGAVASRTGSSTAQSVANAASKGTVAAPIGSNTGRAVVGGTGVGVAGTGGLAAEQRQAGQQGVVPESLEGVAEGIVNAVSPVPAAGGELLDRATDALREDQ